MTKNKIMGIIIIIIGIGVGIFSVGNIKSNNEKQAKYIETTATIVRYEECEMDETTGTHFVAEYKVDRNTYEITEKACSNLPGKNKKTVKIKYNPDNPADAVFSNEIGHYIVPIVAAIFIACGIFMFKKVN